jgi:glycosyltransferase involved in cell wall biosynthesis
MRIGDRQFFRCDDCSANLEWTLSQSVASPGKADWRSEAHECEEGTAEHTRLCDNEVEGVWGKFDAERFTERRGYDPECDPRITPVDEVAWLDPHITCVMPTTKSRAWCIERSILCFLEQTYEHCDLLVVSDGPDGEVIKALAEEFDPFVRHVHLDGERSLGHKYNAAVDLARGPYIALWADDDWNSPHRLDAVMRAMQAARKPIGGTNTMLAHRLSDKQTFLYWNQPLKPYLIGGTMIFHKKLWAACGGFPDWRRGSDTELARRMLFPTENLATQWAVVNDPRLYVAFVHGGNTGNPLNDKNGDDAEVWTKLDGEEGNLRRYLGKDAAAFGF